MFCHFFCSNQGAFKHLTSMVYASMRAYLTARVTVRRAEAPCKYRHRFFYKNIVQRVKRGRQNRTPCPILLAVSTPAQILSKVQF